jgi:hypothetical protein
MPPLPLAVSCACVASWQRERVNRGDEAGDVCGYHAPTFYNHRSLRDMTYHYPILVQKASLHRFHLSSHWRLIHPWIFVESRVQAHIPHERLTGLLKPLE